jgi:hypothetical protein
MVLRPWLAWVQLLVQYHDSLTWMSSFEVILDVTMMLIPEALISQDRWPTFHQT